MYHDEFAPRCARNRGDVGGAYSALAIEVGGGLSASVAVAMALPTVPILLSVGGLLPLIACCFGILVDRFGTALSDQLPHFSDARLFPGPGDVPTTVLRGPRFSPGRPRAVRAGFDRSRRLG
jgi:hypothetical protein